MTKQSEVDQRRHTRFELFEYALAFFPALAEPRQVVVVNIGLGGLQLRSRDALPIGGLCRIQVSGADAAIPVEVRYCDFVSGSDLFAVGIRFKPVTHEERILIANYVHEVFQRHSDLLTT